jgi:hypothetical protein
MGQAMIGELDRLDGRTRRWRFALGCVGAALVLPPWGRAVGRRAARLAAISAALGVYLYGVLAVAVLGAGGHPLDDGSTPPR